MPWTIPRDPPLKYIQAGMPLYSNITRVSIELVLSPVVHVQFVKTDDQNAELFMSSAANESFYWQHTMNLFSLWVILAHVG